MKKLLIAMLALITALSISLTACGDKKKKDDEPVDDEPDDEFVVRDDDETDDTTKGEGDDTTKVPTGTWIDKNDMVYVLQKCKIRPIAGTTQKEIAIAEFGQSFQRVATNGTWDKITFADGTDGVAYISNELLTTDARRVTFDDRAAENKLLHLKPSGNESPTQSNLRAYPTGLATSLGTITEVETSNPANSLKLLGLSADGSWAKVSYTGTIGSKTYTDQVCYITTEYITEFGNGTGDSQLPG